jgi:hypothetical protein
MPACSATTPPPPSLLPISLRSLRASWEQRPPTLKACLPASDCGIVLPNTALAWLTSLLLLLLPSFREFCFCVWCLVSGVCFCAFVCVGLRLRGAPPPSLAGDRGRIGGNGFGILVRPGDHRSFRRGDRLGKLSTSKAYQLTMDPLPNLALVGIHSFMVISTSPDTGCRLRIVKWPG